MEVEARNKQIAPGEAAKSSVCRIRKRATVLNCLNCRKRKISCDNKFPCSRCERLCLTCVVPTRKPRKRRREICDLHSPVVLEKVAALSQKGEQISRDMSVLADSTSSDTQWIKLAEAQSRLMRDYQELYGAIFGRRSAVQTPSSDENECPGMVFSPDFLPFNVDLDLNVGEFGF